MRGRRPTVPRQMGKNVEGTGWPAPCIVEGPQNLDFESPCGNTCPCTCSGVKVNLRILCAFQNVFMHLVIARLAAACAAGGIHYYPSAGPPGGRIEPDGATGEFERSWTVCKTSPRVKAHLGPGGIEFPVLSLAPWPSMPARSASSTSRQGQGDFFRKASSGVTSLGPVNWEFSTGNGQQPPSQADDICPKPKGQGERSPHQRQEPLQPNVAPSRVRRAPGDGARRAPPWRARSGTSSPAGD